ncbi:uncharacterized protein [Macaca fascicularis]|uniref:uncharacterized protein n=1 Tax=Macaca fascicularis TaxID=9541 RepID=UPI003D153D39
MANTSFQNYLILGWSSSYEGRVNEGPEQAQFTCLLSGPLPAPGHRGNTHVSCFHALGVCSTAASTSGAHGSAVKDSGAPIHLKGIRGGSVLLHVIEKLRVDGGAELEEVLWALGTPSNYTQLLRVHRGAVSPIWWSLEDKFKQKVHVPSMSSLRTENLAPEDSGQNFAVITSTEEDGILQVFYFTVYGGGLQENQGVDDGGIPFQTLSQQVSQKGKDKAQSYQLIAEKIQLSEWPGRGKTEELISRDLEQPEGLFADSNQNTQHQTLIQLNDKICPPLAFSQYLGKSGLLSWSLKDQWD